MFAVIQNKHVQYVYKKLIRASKIFIFLIYSRCNDYVGGQADLHHVAYLLYFFGS